MILKLYYIIDRNWLDEQTRYVSYNGTTYSPSNAKVFQNEDDAIQYIDDELGEGYYEVISRFKKEK